MPIPAASPAPIRQQCVSVGHFCEHLDGSIEDPALTLREPVPRVSCGQSRHDLGDLVTFPTPQPGDVGEVQRPPLAWSGADAATGSQPVVSFIIPTVP